MLNRRDALGASLATMTALSGAAAAPAGAAGASSAPSPADQPHAAMGYGFTPLADANPLEARITVFTTVSPDVDASIRFYRDVIGMTLAEAGALPGDITSAPGIGKAVRRHAVLDALELLHIGRLGPYPSKLANLIRQVAKSKRAGQLQNRSELNHVV